MFRETEFPFCPFKANPNPLPQILFANAKHLFEKTETALYGTLLIKSHGEPDRIFGFGNSKIWREAAGIVLFRILFETGIPQKADMAAKRFPRFLTSMIVTFSWTSSTAIEKHLLFGARWKIDFTGEKSKDWRSDRSAAVSCRCTGNPVGNRSQKERAQDGSQLETDITTCGDPCLDQYIHARRRNNFNRRSQKANGGNRH